MAESLADKIAQKRRERASQYFKCGKTYITLRGYPELPQEFVERTGKLVGDPVTLTVRKTDIIAVTDISNKKNEGYLVQTPARGGGKGTSNLWISKETRQSVISCLD